MVALGARMYGRPVGPIWVDEFTAGYLYHILEDELESLTEQLHERRDNFDCRGWGYMKVRIDGLHDLWLAVDRLHRKLGDAPDEVLERYANHAVRTGERMPRSKANATEYSEDVKRRHELRARVKAARKAHRASKKRR